MSSSSSSSHKAAVNASTSYSSQPASQAALTAALVDNGSIPVIQGALLHELQASGWAQNLRDHVTALMRSGECTRYDDLMDRVLDQALAGLDSPDSAGDLNVPRSAIAQGVKVVKKELEKVCTVETS